MRRVALALAAVALASTSLATPAPPPVTPGPPAIINWLAETDVPENCAPDFSYKHRDGSGVERWKFSDVWRGTYSCLPRAFMNPEKIVPMAITDMEIGGLLRLSVPRSQLPQGSYDAYGPPDGVFFIRKAEGIFSYFWIDADDVPYAMLESGGVHFTVVPLDWWPQRGHDTYDPGPDGVATGEIRHGLAVYRGVTSSAKPQESEILAATDPELGIVEVDCGSHSLPSLLFGESGSPKYSCSATWAIDAETVGEVNFDKEPYLKDWRRIVLSFHKMWASWRPDRTSKPN